MHVFDLTAGKSFYVEEQDRIQTVIIKRKDALSNCVPLL